jgi:tRNA(Ile)-lysidine synthetase-like protein
LNGGKGLPCALLSKQHKAIGSRLVRKLFTEQFHHTTDLSRRQTEQLLDLAKSGCGNTKVSLANGIVARIEGEVLFFTEEGTDGPDGLHTVKFGSTEFLVFGYEWAEEVEMDIGEEFFSVGSREISSPLFSVELILVENPEQLVYNNRTWYCACENLSRAVIRTPRTEDHLTRAGQSSGKSLRRFMTDRKIPAFLREKMILFAQGHDILWIPGVAHAVGFVDEVSLDRYLGRSGHDNLFEKGSRAICKVTLKQYTFDMKPTEQ